ncbi:MAG: hypothetical protein NTZ78_01565 [Candidatus Aureabacteria bacterium]|nr:hypothetical protein [Candidatus Auribacterota bacterium]
MYLDKSGQFYGYAWGENVGWMHLGPGRVVTYLAKSDPGPWKEMGPKSGDRLAGAADDFEMKSGSVPLIGLNLRHERYNRDYGTACSPMMGRDDFSAHIRCCDTRVHIINLARLFPVRAPPSTR